MSITQRLSVLTSARHCKSAIEGEVSTVAEVESVESTSTPSRSPSSAATTQRSARR